ncbi:MAG TPA: GNAT family N-acetyltransferase [Ktedonobacteraceae bacterium]|nr:GNAT family N-acetyltransferase [Ktedonobacteraceae bacterium]
MQISQRGYSTQRLQPRLALARLNDFDAVAQLFAALHDYNTSLDEKFALAAQWQPLLREHFVRTYQSEDALWLLAWMNNEPVGLLILELHIDSPLFQHHHWVELVALYVAPACRRMGLARRLMAQAEDWTTAYGCDRMQLYVTAQNERARDFYRQCGWQPVQEIWRMQVGPLSTTTISSVDPSGQTENTEGGCRSQSDLLEHGHHQMAMETHASDQRQDGNEKRSSATRQEGHRQRGEEDAY